jgi:hypothetical protein
LNTKKTTFEDWYAHKLANPWILPSINKFLSKITPSDWDLTPNHSNYVETAHAGRNAETSVGVGLLTAILQCAPSLGLFLLLTSQ